VEEGCPYVSTTRARSASGTKLGLEIKVHSLYHARGVCTERDRAAGAGIGPFRIFRSSSARPLKLAGEESFSRRKRVAAGLKAREEKLVSPLKSQLRS
jgi:hypothetical protein